MTNSRKKILIAGYYGFGNAGDEAILAAMLADLRGRRSDLDFVVVTANPTETMARYHVETMDWKDIDGLLNAARESDLILLGGGGIFHDYWGVPREILLTRHHWGIPFYSGIGLLAALHRVPFMIYAVGIGPLLRDEGRWLTRQTAELADVVTVRDAESRDCLAAEGIPAGDILVTADPALNLPADTERAAEILGYENLTLGGQPLLGVCIRNWAGQEGEGGDAWKTALAGALDRFLEKHQARVFFIPFQVSDNALEDDHAVAREVTGQMRHADRATSLSRAYPPEVVCGLVGACDLVVGMRLHSLVFAAGSAVPAVALAYDPKVRNFMAALGYPGLAFDLQTLEAGQLFEALENTWEARVGMRQELAQRCDALKTLARQSSALALELLDKGPAAADSAPALDGIRSLAIKQTGMLAERDHELAQALGREQALMARADRLNLENHELRGQLNEIVYSKAWKMVLVLRRLRTRILPVGSFRERVTRAVFQFVRNLVYQVSRFGSLARQSIRRHGLPKAILRGLRLYGIRSYQANKGVIHREEYERALAELEALIDRHTGFYDVFHVPMGWQTALFQRFQHISLQVSKMGGLALYGGHPIVDLGITVYREAAENLVVIDATDRQVVERVIQAIEKKPQPKILRVQSIDLVTTAEDINRFIERGFQVVYEYIDEINPAITGNVPDLVYRRHKALLRDERVIVVTTADQLYEEAQLHRTRNLVLSTNGVDLDHWRRERGEPPEDLRPVLTGNTVVGYHGALAKWIDWGLLRAIADQGEYELLLIGYEHDEALSESGLLDHPRAHFLGSKSYFELNAYAPFYDVAILPFKKTELTDSVSPVKIFEYMAASKPIVTTDLRECRKYKSCLVARDRRAFLAQLELAASLREDPAYLSVLAAEAEENSWRKKTLEVLRLAGVEL